MKRQTLISLIIGIIAVISLLSATYVFSRAEQCPANYTQQQVDTSSCTASANIGLTVIIGISAVALITITTTGVIASKKH